MFDAVRVRLIEIGEASLGFDRGVKRRLYAAQGVPLHDFSTNANACGPCPQAWRAVQAADATRYPDAGYQALRERLARWKRGVT